MTGPSNEPPLSFVRAKSAQEREEWSQAETGYRETLEHFPDAMPAYANLAVVLIAQEKWEEAEQVLEGALNRWPREPDLRFNLALSKLAAGDYEAGFPLYEARRYVEDSVRVPALSFPEWDGRQVHSLLLFPEQGLGDQIHFARYVPLLRERQVEVTLACDPSLMRLFEPLGVRILAARGEQALDRHDAWAFLGSLPLRFGTTLETIPPPISVHANPIGSGGIGVAVRGAPSHRNDRNRSLPPDVATTLLDLPGSLSLLPEDTHAEDFQATADIIAGLDLVISVDTSIAHLAASIGKPTWILIPRKKTDWRWMREREDSPWYPSARLFRQQRSDDWTEVVRRVYRELGLRAPS